MLLFDDTELFTTGTRGHVAFDLPDAEVYLVDRFIDKDLADSIYHELLNETPWQEYQMEMYDKMVTVPRMIAWYEDKTNAGADQKGLDWTPTLLAIRKMVEAETGIEFNSVLLNLYRSGNDGVSWHSDREHTIGQNPAIASVTFGQTRMFRLRHKVLKDQKNVEIPLHHGSFLLMSGTTNTYWQHEVPKTSKNVLPRINLTFRVAKRN